MGQQELQSVSITLRKWRSAPGNLIMILHEVQDSYGYVPRETAKEIAKDLNIPLAQIWEVLTFYHLFKLRPPGKYVISVCLGTACYLNGSEKILEAFSDKLGISVGKSTTDGLFHLQTVRCLGCCGLAPVTMVNGKVYSKVKPHDVHSIIHDCMEQEQEGLQCPEQ